MMPLRLKGVVSALAAAALLAACSAMPKLESDKVEYRTASRLPQLEVPPDLTRPTADDRYAVPDINPKGQATYSAYSKDRAAAPDSSRKAPRPRVMSAWSFRTSDMKRWPLRWAR